MSLAPIPSHGHRPSQRDVQAMSPETRVVINEGFDPGLLVMLDALGWNQGFTGTITLECLNGRVKKVKPAFVI